MMGASSSSSSSSSKGAKNMKGENWEFQVYFDPESDQHHGKYCKISDDSLMMKMGELIDDSEKITNIWVYRCPLYAWQFSQLLFNHQCVVLETNDWWWSIEKNSKEIAIQRSKDKKWVRDYFKQEARNKPVDVLSCDKGRKSMKDLIKFLYSKAEVNKTYHWADDNCKDFAERIFNTFAAKKSHGQVMGSD